MIKSLLTPILLFTSMTAIADVQCSIPNPPKRNGPPVDAVVKCSNGSSVISMTPNWSNGLTRFTDNRGNFCEGSMEAKLAPMCTNPKQFEWQWTPVEAIKDDLNNVYLMSDIEKELNKLDAMLQKEYGK